MVAKDLLPRGLPLDIAKTPTQQKVAFQLISFLDATLGSQSSHPAKTGRLNLPPTGKSLGLLASAIKASYCF